MLTNIADMYDFSSSLFWYKIVFLIEICVAGSLICGRLKCKSNFILRLAVSMVILIVITFALPILSYSSYYTIFLFFMIFALFLCGMKSSHDEKWGSIVFCGSWAYTTQHIAYQIYTLIITLLGINEGNLYSGDLISGEYAWLSVTIFIEVHAVVYVLIWGVTRLKLARVECLNLRKWRLLVLSVAILFIDIVLNAFIVNNETAESKFVLSFFCVYGITSCVLILILQFSMIDREKLETELRIVETLWDKDKRLYESRKENIEYINIKCHDLRHRMRAIRTKGHIDQSELKEIERAINIYEETMKTGNEVVDIVLSEESVLCHNNNINLLCVVDGELVNFIQSGDLYSLLQNSIHNAFDAVKDIQDDARRIIRFTVKRINEMVYVGVENYCDGIEGLEFKDGLPVSKGDSRLHGFGMKSISAIVNKYGGAMNIKAENGIFKLNILFPYYLGNKYVILYVLHNLIF